MKYFVKTKEGYVMNVPKIEILLRKAEEERVVSTLDAPLKTIKHGSTHRIFFIPSATPLSESQAKGLEEDLKRLNSLCSRVNKFKRAIEKARLSWKFFVS